MDFFTAVTAAATDYTTFTLRTPDYSFGWREALTFGGLAVFILALAVATMLTVSFRLTRRLNVILIIAAILGFTSLVTGLGAVYVGVSEATAEERQVIISELDSRGVNVSDADANTLHQLKTVTIDDDGHLTVIELHVAKGTFTAGFTVNGQPI